ncbi:hypothetical protein CRE_13931 [Caenorhabditis remanei]|uniref:Uncharacterized protein n=2 Tax=Caenorhabditis remanei TaxID=31234 RepID=E3M8U3_CAERE|nr:hypothetical protein CRE_13931 [Caenorhabditis remanei]
MSIHRRRQLPASPDDIATGNVIYTPMTPQIMRRCHPRLQEVRSFDPALVSQLRNESSHRELLTGDGYHLCVDMRNIPARSQSFKHRPKPMVEVRRMAVDDVGPHERRRSTPTVSRRPSLQKSRIMEPRTDVWPEAKNSGLEERFLKLPDSEDYTRVRQFKIDEKGAVVSRGDSFRRKRTPTYKSDKSPSPFPVSVSTDSARGSRSESEASEPPISDELNKMTLTDLTNASTSHKTYKIYVVGDTGTGKSSLISQLITSEYKNAFADEIQDYENTVSICIGGVECDLVFFESDMADPCWLTNEVHAFLVVYSIDSKSSWKQAMLALEMIRDRPGTRNLPMLVAGNKIDLERKRTVTKQEVRAAKAAMGFEHFEISVALDHDVDDLLVGLVAEIQEAFAPESVLQKPSPRHHPIDDFHSAIRRYSQRKKKAPLNDLEGGKCSVLSPTGLFAKFKNWRRGSSPRIETN